jgi:hypothetical protein
MDLELYKRPLGDIYLVSNTPSFLYDKMRRSPIVAEYLAKASPDELITEFDLRVKQPIESAAEIAILYGLLVALTFKQDAKVRAFFESVRDHIKFEWFSTIAKYYLTERTPTDSITVQVNPPQQVDNPAIQNINVRQS